MSFTCRDWIYFRLQGCPIELNEMRDSGEKGLGLTYVVTTLTLMTELLNR